jgi:hypothetical protein
MESFIRVLKLRLFKMDAVKEILPHPFFCKKALPAAIK